MKRLVSLISGCLAFVVGMAQTVQITTDKTTSLIFPFTVLHADRGTKDILVQGVKESPNVLLVKAGAKNFSNTNLSVVTTDGSVYSFAIEYADEPAQWIIYVPVQNNEALETIANNLLNNRPSVHGVYANKWDMRSRITGIYIKKEVIYYQLRLDNDSPVDYDIDFIRFYIRDKKKRKRTAVQENELKPLYVAGNTSQVKSYSRSLVVVALDKFTIPDAKYFAIEINEKNGGRHLRMKLGNKKIMRAIPLADIK